MLHETFLTWREAMDFYNSHKDDVTIGHYLILKTSPTGGSPYVIKEIPIKRPDDEIKVDGIKRTTGVISDHLDNVVNPVDGRVYDSKSAYYRTLKERGLEIDDRKHVEFTPPQSRFDERKFDAAFKKTLEQLNV